MPTHFMKDPTIQGVIERSPRIQDSIIRDGGEGTVVVSESLGSCV